MFPDYRAWQTLTKKKREKTLKRDNYRCQVCGKEQKLDVAHIVGLWVSYPPHWILDWIENLCPECGRRSFYKRKNKEPRYRCKNCGAEFNEAISGERVRKRIWDKGKKMAEAGLTHWLAH